MRRLTPIALHCGLAAVLLFALASCKQSKKKPASSAGDASVAATKTPHEVATTTLLEALENRYSHRDLRGIDWKKLVSESSEKLNASSSAKEYGQHLASILAVAKDSHVSIKIDGVEKPIFTFAPPLHFNVDLSEIAKAVKGIRDENKCISVGKVNSKTGYLLLKSFARSLCPDFASSFNRAWSELEALPMLVIDVRPNTGGDENLARIVAARFVEGDVDYAMTEFGPPRPDSVKVPRRLIGAPASARFAGDVRVLVGGANISSAEAFILMMKQAPRSKTVGAKSYGSSGNPKSLNLGNGVTISLPSWRTFSPSGQALESKGLEPDVVSGWLAGQGDPVLKVALSSFE